MEDFAALDVVIGLALLFFVMATIVSAVNELIQTVLNQRSRTLTRAISALLGDAAAPAKEKRWWEPTRTVVGAFFDEERVRVLASPPGPVRTLARKLHLPFVAAYRRPSNVPARIFSLTVLESATRDSKPRIGTALYVRARDTVEKIGLPPVDPGKVTLTDRQQKVDATRVELERAFDEVMDRASGWYKRWVQWWVVLLSAALAIAINANAFTVAEVLWQEGVNELPLGRGENVPPVGDDWTKWGGWFVTAAAVSLGAPFWFDVFGKFSQLRGTGNREGTEKSDRAPEDRDDPSGRR